MAAAGGAGMSSGGIMRCETQAAAITDIKTASGAEKPVGMGIEQYRPMTQRASWGADNGKDGGRVGARAARSTGIVGVSGQ